MNENIKSVLAILDDFRTNDEITYPAYSTLYDEISLLDDLLKAQESVKPINVYMYNKMYANVRSGYCPICNNAVDEEEDNNFCCKCGRRLNWND